MLVAVELADLSKAEALREDNMSVRELFDKMLGVSWACVAGDV